MPASSFADIIIDNLDSAIGKDSSKFSKSTPDSANKAIADAITSYLLDNTTITVSYTGIIPGTPPSPDPVVVDILEIEGKCEPPGTATNFNDWILDLGAKIQNGFFLSKGKAGITTEVPKSIKCFTGLPLIIDRDSKLKSVHEGNIDNPQKAIWETICSEIINWLNSISGIPFTGKNEKSGSKGSGTTTITLVK